MFAVTPELWRQSLEAALSAENEYRSVFILMAVAGLFSAAAVVITIAARRRGVLRAVLVCAIGQVGLYAAFGAWFFALVASFPACCVYMVKNEV